MNAKTSNRLQRLQRLRERVQRELEQAARVGDYNGHWEASEKLVDVEIRIQDLSHDLAA